MRFHLIYSGPALEGSDIDASKLGHSLIAVHDLLREANFIINGEEAKVKVKVKASFKTGSFGIDFEIIQSALKNLFSSKVANALTVLTSVIAVIRLIKWLKGQKADKFLENEDGSFTVYKGDKYLKAEKRTIDLYKSYKLRKSLEITTSISEKEGIKEVAFHYKQGKEKKFETITAEESLYFSYIEDIDVANEIDKIQILEIISLSFRSGMKWKVTDGANAFNISIRDEKFISQIEERKQAFQKHDKIKAKVVEKQFLEQDTLKKEYYLSEVLEYITQPTQTQLPHK